MTNLGNAREIMGRFGGDQTDGLNPSRLEHSGAVVTCMFERSEEDPQHRVSSDSLRNKRSVSVDSGLLRDKGLMYGGRKQQQQQKHVAIMESDEMDVSDAAESVERRKRRPKGGAEGDECDLVNAAAGRRKAKGTTSTGSRLRGRAPINT